MAVDNLQDVINSLTPPEREAVREFIEFLREKGRSKPSEFLTAADEFMAQHPELLRRLAE